MSERLEVRVGPAEGADLSVELCPPSEALRVGEARRIAPGLIRTVAPRWGSDPYADGSEKLGHRLEDVQLGQCYQQCLELARDAQARCLALPLLHSGPDGVPADRAIKTAVGHLRFFLQRNAAPERVVLTCASEAEAALVRRELVPRDVSSPIQIGGLRTRS
ncbi:MAG: macro domain-containing protein [Myxococcota bacterium]